MEFILACLKFQHRFIANIFIWLQSVLASDLKESDHKRSFFARIFKENFDLKVFC